MQIPEKKVEGWLDELVTQCDVSRKERITRASRHASYYYKGTDNVNPAPYNQVRRHINRLSSYIYTPGTVRYAIEFDRTTGEPWLSRAGVAGRHLSREYRARGLDIRFSSAVKQGNMRGCSFAKHYWGPSGPTIDVVWPEFMGVLREDLTELDEQQAFCQTSWYLPDELYALMSWHPDAARIVVQAAKQTADEDREEIDYFHQVVIGGTQPLQNPGARGIVNPWPIGPQLDPKISASLIRFDEVWVKNDKLEDYTTFWRVGRDFIIEGRDKRRNLFGVKGEHGFVKVCSNPTEGYFWGESEVDVIDNLQDMLSERVLDIKRILRMQGKPPKGFIGFTGITQEKYNAAMRRGGFITSDNPNAKIEDLSPKVPENAWADVQQIVVFIDEQGGFKPIMQGEGEAGVRAGVHAQTLLRTASPELRERALIVEGQAAESGELVFMLMQAHDAKCYTTDKKETILLAQMPDDWNVTVDSHSSSPAFANDEMNKAFALHKAGAISAERLIELIHPPREDTLVADAKAKAEAEAKFIAEHPEVFAKGKKR